MSHWNRDRPFRNAEKLTACRNATYKPVMPRNPTPFHYGDAWRNAGSGPVELDELSSWTNCLREATPAIPLRFAPPPSGMLRKGRRADRGTAPGVRRDLDASELICYRREHGKG
jgi:hypothetical protein